MTRPARQTPRVPFRLWTGHLLPLLRPHRVALSGAALAMVLDAALTVLRPWPLKVVIDLALAHRHSRVPFVGGWLAAVRPQPMSVVYGACAATILIALSTGVLTYWYTKTLGDIGQRFAFVLRRTLFDHMQRLSLRFHDRQRTGDLITRLTSDIQALREVVGNGSILLVSNACLLGGMIAMMLWLNWQFALAALSVAPLLFWTVFRYSDRMRAAVRHARMSEGLLASVAQESLSSIRIVQGLAQEEHQVERFQVQNTGSLNAYLEGIRYQARVAPQVDLLAAVGLAVVMWYGATRVLAGLLTTGDVVVFFAYVTNLYSPMKALSRLSSSFTRAGVAVERIVEVLRVRSEVVQAKDARPAPRFAGRIEFTGVSFEYAPGQPVLAGIDLVVEPGTTLAIVGATGAGKSTLVSLIPRLYDPAGGTIRIDGEDIRRYTVQSLRDRISLVLQDSLLFSGTIRENIAFGRPDADEQEIIRAAALAQAEEFIVRLPDGYDTMVAERGSTLSGGQKQRIAIARAILRDAPILILDEPTSGLDAASEHGVMTALRVAAAGRTTLTIAHRLRTVRFADRIIVLDRGRVVEEGTHAELLSREGRYASLCELQLTAD
jgi:subfamily B ATP-binding cassette protein MsbA